MDQSKSPDGVVQRLVDYSTTLVSPRDMDLIDEAVGTIGYLVRQRGERDQVIVDMKARLGNSDEVVSLLRHHIRAILDKRQQIIGILDEFG